MPMTRSFPRFVQFARAFGAFVLGAAFLAGPAAAEDDRPAYGVIVRLKTPASADTARVAPQRAKEALARAFQAKSMPLGAVRPLDGRQHVVQWARPLNAAEARRLVEELRADPEVEWAEPNVMERRFQAATTPAPTDPEYVRQWWLSATPGPGSRGVPNIQAAWARATGLGHPVNVAVLDTGLTAHPELGDPARFDTGYDLVTNEDGLAGDGDGRDPDFFDPGDFVSAGTCGSGTPEEPSSWHGTRIAGQIAAQTNNGVGVAGANWGARLISVRVAGKCGALVSDILAGMRWAAGLQVEGLPVNPHPARIVSLSFGGSGDCRVYQPTIDELVGKGVLIVAAAGNEDGAVARPARCRGVLGVGAVNRDGFKAKYSNLGPEIGITTVGGDGAAGSFAGAYDREAEDGGIHTTTNNGVQAPGAPGYESTYGTSFSTPIVAAAASLMLAVNPQLTLDELVHGMKVTARPHVADHPSFSLLQCRSGVSRGRCYCTTSTCGAGLLDVAGALAYAQDPLPYGPAPSFWSPAPPGGNGGGESDGDGDGGGVIGAAWAALLGLAALAAAGSTRRVRSS